MGSTRAVRFSFLACISLSMNNLFSCCQTGVNFARNLLCKESKPFRRLAAVPYYHYYVPREEVDELLIEVGDFLLRAIVTKQGKIAVLLSVRGPQKVEHFLAVYRAPGIFCFSNDVARKCLPDLVDYYMAGNVAVHQGYYLKRSISRTNQEFLSDQITFDSSATLGEGNFAVVTKGKLVLPGHYAPIDVACKRIRIEKCRTYIDKVEAKREIVRELHVGRMLRGHPHITSVYGMYIETEELALLMEFCSRGSADLYLKNSTDLPVLEKLNILYHAADGICYMHYNSLIHRDIACRNLLVSMRDELNLTPLIKVSDFGLTRLGPVFQASGQEAVPFIISAVECLGSDAYWTFKSDCWSFGVLIWEVFTGASIEPYSLEAANIDGSTLLDSLKQGLRLRPTDDMPNDVARLMVDCFDVDCEKRPQMSVIRQRIFNAMTAIA